MQSLTDATEKLNIADTVKFIGGQFGGDKETCFIDADAFILPSFSEGLPMAVLEAWAYKLPVIMTSYCNIPEGFEKDAAIKVEPEVQSISAGMEELFALSPQKRAMKGENGYALVKDKFTWDKVSAATMDLYKWITGGKERPAFVISD
jgi:glycosyltransferase involved in cell wall biosynthesis